jgi:phosphoribosylformylglycinamidine synthase
LVKSGLLPGNPQLKQKASLVINDSGKFEDRWVHLKSLRTDDAESRCVWAKGLPQVIYLPVAHGEGKFIVDDQAVLRRLNERNQVVFKYCSGEGRLSGYPDNPNGSVENIAGICDESGRILGLMPHPERHIEGTQHPRWTATAKKGEGDGLQIFRNGVEYCKKHL